MTTLLIIQEFSELIPFLSLPWKNNCSLLNKKSNQTHLILTNSQKQAILISTEKFYGSLNWFQWRQNWIDKKWDLKHYIIAPEKIIQSLYLNNSLISYEENTSSKHLEFLTEMVQIALLYNATDIHCDIQEQRAIISFRRYTQLSVWRYFPSQELIHVLAAAYNLNALESSRTDSTFNRRVPQSALIPLSIKDQEVHIRYQSHPVLGGICAVLRLLRMDYPCHLSLETMGYLPTQIEKIHKALAYGKGGIFIAGATGSGKTTTLSILMNILGKIYPEKKRYALEDPTEYRLENVMHMSIRSSENESNTEQALRSFLRMDPNIGMIGEIRDKETALLVQTAIETGHQILSTIHAHSAWGIIDRLSSPILQLQRNAILSPGFLQLLIYQKLLPTNCPNCCLPATQFLEKNDLEYLEKFYQLDLKKIFCSSGKGCNFCLPNKTDKQFLSSSGTAGVVVAAEIINPHKSFITDKEKTPLLSREINKHTLYHVNQGKVDPRHLPIFPKIEES